MTRDPRRGAALLIVLLFCALLAALAAAATRTSLSGARAAAVFADGVRAEALGRGAADALAFRLVVGDADAKRGGAVGLRLTGAEVTIDYVSESARVDANAAPVALIAALLAASGAETADVEAATARVASFRAAAAARAKAGSAGEASSPDGGGAPAAGGLAAIRAAVDALGPAAKAKPAATGPAAIRDLSEVAAAWGLSDDLAARVLPSLTVSTGRSTVDPVLAGRTVLLALLGADERADDFMSRRRQGFADKGSALALLPVPSRDFVAFDDAPAVRAAVRVRVAGRFERRFELVLAPPDVDAAGAAPGAAPAAAPPDPEVARDAPGPAGPGAIPVVVSWRVVS